MDDPDDLIRVYETESVTEAHLVKNLLLDEGIEAAVSGEHKQFSAPLAAAEVLVRRADEVRARLIVDAFDAEQLRRADRPDWTCAKCGATVIGAFVSCDACGADRPGTENAE